MKYIVVAKPDADLAAFEAMLDTSGATVEENYGALKRHYLIDIADVSSIENHADTQMVRDAEEEITLLDTQPINVLADGTGDNWGLSRIDQRDWDDTTWYPNTGNYNFARQGTGVDIYVIDTGVRKTHDDFGGRAVELFDYFNSPSSSMYCVDEQGHGTHVASTAAGSKYGVAKNATIQICKVFRSSSTTISAIIGGINAALAHHNDKKVAASTRPSVINLSLGGPVHSVEEQAINDCIDAGIVVVAAAGNDGKNLDSDQYDVMPAEIVRCLTVGSTDIQDNISGFSNYGSTVDIFAPGSYITAASHISDSVGTMKSGTSMAAPHVAGVVALHAQNGGIGTDAAYVAKLNDWVKNSATMDSLNIPGKIKAAGTMNKLLFSYYIDNTVTEPTGDGSSEGETALKPKNGGGKRWRNLVVRGGRRRTRNLDKAIDKVMGEYYPKYASFELDAIITELETSARELATSAKKERIAAFDRFWAALQTAKVAMSEHREFVRANEGLYSVE